MVQQARPQRKGIITLTSQFPRPMLNAEMKSFR
jgi:hypothetical protein